MSVVTVFNEGEPVLSEKQQETAREVFKTMSSLDKRLIAIRIVCAYSINNGYGFEKTLMQTIIRSGFTDEKGKLLTQFFYEGRLKQLSRLQFLQNKRDNFVICKELHHAILLLMPAEDIRWVFSIVDALYPKKTLEFKELQNSTSYGYFQEDKAQIRAHLIKAIYINKPDYFIANHNNPNYCNKIAYYLQDIFGEFPIDMKWLQSRHKVIQSFICIALLGCYYCESGLNINHGEMLNLWTKLDLSDVEHDALHYYSGIIYLSLGHIEKVIAHRRQIKDLASGFSLSLQAATLFLTNQTELASNLYRKALAALKNQYNNRLYYFDTILGIFHYLTLAYVENRLPQLNANTVQYKKYAQQQDSLSLPMNIVYTLLPIITVIEQGDCKGAEQWMLGALKNPDDPSIPPLTLAIYHLLRFMTNKAYSKISADKLYSHAMRCIQKNQLLAAHLLYELLATTDKYQEAANVFLEESPIKFRFLEFINVKDSWEYSFQALEGLLLENSVASLENIKRLLWLVDPDKQTVSVLEQSLGKSGRWTSGKMPALSKLKNFGQHEQFNYLSADDKAALEFIVMKEFSYDEWDESRHSDSYVFDNYHTILALIGHKHIVQAKNKDVAIELVRGEPELHIEDLSLLSRPGVSGKQDLGYRFSLSHWLPKAGLIIEPESLNKYRVIDFSNAFVSIGQILTKNGLSIPASAKEKVLRVIQHAKKDIHIHVGVKDIIPEIEGDHTPYVQLLPTREGVRATLWVRPLASQGTYYKAGQGKESVMALMNENGTETRVRIMRDFAQEKSNQARLLAKSPSLLRHEYEPGEYEIHTPEETLEVLSELQQYATIEPLIIEWPEGQTFKIKQRIFSSNMALNITSGTNWFEFGGKLTLDDGEVLNMESLLESLSRQSYGRFVRLGNGEFIELTHSLKKQLTLLHAISEGNRINPLGAQILSDIVAEAEFTTFDAGWEAHLKKLHTMKTHTPKVPSTLQAKLRDYQIEGFQYLSRLTHWGIGACLADDMGLGKTVQAIALLLERAKYGATLVIAPTSVGFNWAEELNKFAPTLKVHNLRTDDRVTVVEKASKFDVVICSYGLLQHNNQLLSDKEWETIVLDEAQAIKNANTQRWKTVMTLKGKSRIALSGTPIENHLGELWSIFSFINPGLLGTIKSFQDKYSTPIETRHDPEKVQALKTIVSPYILRRLKSEVLSELPPKIEQTIHVEQTEEEAIFYEALRRKAEQRMAGFIEENNRIAVLAEITKLRQACCDSSLINGGLSIENSKLNSFIEVCKNIINNGHKALVFSQYVSFLKIVKNRVEEEKLSYQYLDGSTSPANRKKSVNAFQSGEGDLFLLSLKAGGSGLNLTAADYVIHLDPWWNPAVEDQASDRAHRIGQERSVTIYRFIMKNTIEEKILSLHEHKRNLASELLSGQGISGKLSNEDLMSLIGGSVSHLYQADPGDKGLYDAKK